ncbi:hypothetical protein L1281_001510 [Neisseria sp. HSC-16F19]|nr:hypothetical protein [Neisseria sp. HSC-16F19]MCP2040920.1 hypothetical protein [Neisseria sp. HSC-16F19]
MQLTLALPGFTHAHDPAFPPLSAPALQRLLHWGRVERYAEPEPRSRFYARRLWQGSLLQTENDRLPENRHAFCCSPLYQQIGMHSVQAAHGAVLNITAAEAAQWCADLSGFFAADGWQFQPLRPDLWRVTCPQDTDWHSPCILDLPALLDENSRPEGTGSTALLKIQTEIQMLLHAHALNQNRALPVNAVWFWQDIHGEADPSQTLYSNSPWATQARPLAADFAAWQAQARNPALVFAEDFTQVLEGDAAHYAAVLQEWEARWFAPALAALRSGSLSTVCIQDEHGCLKTRKPALPPFWRPQPVFKGVWP